MSRATDNRILMENTYFLQKEHTSVNFWALLEFAPNQTQTGFNKPGRHYSRSAPYLGIPGNK